MKIIQFISLIWLAFVNVMFCEMIISIDTDAETTNETIYKYYNTGVVEGIINPQKYHFESFLRDERNVFKDSYNEYNKLNGTYRLNYGEWLIHNHYGILPDTQESLFKPRKTKRSGSDNKRRFVKTVRKGDILITGSGIGAFVGHAAIMATDYWVLEMPGGTGWLTGIKDNNRQINKNKWFDLHKDGTTAVYRVPSHSAAYHAASWALRNYYNSWGGSRKTKHITYKITSNFWTKNPSYCSKLVLQAYYYGNEKRRMINNKKLKQVKTIVPLLIPKFFNSRYSLIHKGNF